MRPTLDSAQRRDRAILLAGLAGVSLLAWAYVVSLAGGMSGMAMDGRPSSGAQAMQMAMPNVHPWHAADVVLTFLMWAVMMVAMMTPAAAPMILTFGSITRRRSERRDVISPTAAFLSGYLIVWGAFSAGATALQWALHSAGLLAPEVLRVTPVVGGLLLMLAGVYQLTPWKDTCLSNCRAPMNFLVTEWRDGTAGALVMGVHHGMYCVGCCWSLMLLLFVTGVMNLLWVAAIAAYVLVEKAVSGGRWIGRLAGILTIAWGSWLLAGVLTG